MRVSIDGDRAVLVMQIAGLREIPRLNNEGGLDAHRWVFYVTTFIFAISE